MKLPSEKQVDSSNRKNRKKLWEIHEGYHCSVVGTCLSKHDLQVLARKKLFSQSSKPTEYTTHSVLVGLASVRQPQSRYLQKLLDRKYRLAIVRYKRAGNDEQIWQLWNEDFESGRVAGAYWAVMTHPSPDNKLINEIYGQVHMLGHECMAQFQHRKKTVDTLQTRLSMLEEVLASERQVTREKAALLIEKSQEADGLSLANLKLQGTNEALVRKIKDLESGQHYREIAEERDSLGMELAASRQECNLLCGNMDILSRERDEMLAELERTRAEVLSLKQSLIQAHRQQHEVEEELQSLEAIWHSALNTETHCAACDDRDSDRCPGADLCGKVVLYVGGMHNLVPRYRTIVEQHGGKFLHHDGGREVARSMLPKLLNTADAVVCPVDCVSHDACTCVKKICKRYDKPFVMMRSSGLSSLARGIAEIVQ
ncbi:DUF2325 domain-containing protein [Desulfogranum japonicum]|uniref:DUF2325 domain-containing protein n=1 Tax=Desulfogranum japonicum TaxID=231447 RepID=UPI0003FDCE91|nr:DUF2325 domain-containing protein [Desulfogranum japonicum]